MTVPLLFTLAQSPVESAKDFHLTPGGWTVMLLSVGFVTILLTWCIGKVVTTPGSEEHLHSQSDATPDMDEP
ncbi:MAG: hypothetical protein WC058_06800 [Phycisphaeraceae bacterium]